MTDKEEKRMAKNLQDYISKLGQLKFEMGTKYDDLYNEAIRDLLGKYGKR